MYGSELILDMHDCDVAQFTRRKLSVFFAEICSVIDMEREDVHFWDDQGVPIEDRQTDPKTKGTSAVQFILTSTIVVHCLDELKSVYVNIFSCKEFDEAAAADFTVKFFKAGTSWRLKVHRN